MKKFIRKIIFLLLTLLLFALLLEIGARQIPNNYSYKNQYLSDNAERLEVLVLGSSHSLYGVNPEFFTGTAFNAAHVSQSLKYDCFIFNKFKDDFTNLKVIVMPISYFTLFSQLEDGIEYWRVKNYSLYYDCPYYSDFKSNTEIANGKPFDMLEMIMKYLASGGEDHHVSVSELGFRTRRSKKQVDLVSKGIEAAQRHTADNFDSLDENMERLEQLITDCALMGVRVLMFTPPAVDSYTEHLDEKQLSLMQDSINHIAERYSNADYYSFLQDERFETADFRDADHLNETGAKKLTEIMDDIIQNKFTTQH